MLHRAALASVIAVALAACSTGPTGADTGIDATDVAGSHDTATDGTGGPICASDIQCSDGMFCNGAERCAPAVPGADARGCIAGTPPCTAMQTCSEATQMCTAAGCAHPDSDGDGHCAMGCGPSCDDCDDTDPNRYPGNTEVCAVESTASDAGADAGVAFTRTDPARHLDPTHDEDCDPTTFADPMTHDGDHDGDGYVDAVCCNATTSGGRNCGNDCADLEPVAGMPATFMTSIAAGDIHPMEAEVCNGVDDDCDGHIDNGLPTATYYPDCDGDGYGAMGSTGMVGCSGQAFATCGGHEAVANEGDCDDSNPAVGTCGTTANGVLACVASACVVGTCDPGYSDCDGLVSTGCEVHTTTDAMNCGACAHQCPSVATCNAGACGFVVPSGSPDFSPTMNTTLTSGTHYYGNVTIPAGVTITASGTGELEIVASGAVVIDGTVNLSGSSGAPQSCTYGAAGGGGFTGNPSMRAAVYVGGGGGLAGLGGDGANAHGSGGVYGGGAGAYNVGPPGVTRGGGGGGGPAGGGGGPGTGSSTAGGGTGGTAGAPGTGAAQSSGGAGGGAPYDGATCSSNHYGGGGSIGTAAAADLAVASTFYAGSGGGGSGSASYCGPVTSGDPLWGAGGGGGGGALLIASATSIVLGAAASVLANGGQGESASCGWGSGGVIFLAAPSITIPAGASVSAVGVVSPPSGLGRIRVAVGSACTLAGTFNPPLVSGCSPTAGAGTSGQAYVGSYPF